jgi:serine/threonine protein kinase
MKNHPHAECDPRRIEQCLADALGEEERAAFESHLDSCSDCRAALERCAAEAADWSAAREFLSSHDRPPSESELIAAETDAAGIEAIISALGPTDDPRMLGRLGAYEIAGVVGRGGMGVVLKGFDQALNRYVAIKVLAPHLAMSGAARQRFAREARAAASVVHENVVAIHAVADSGPSPFFVMPYIRGASLEKRLEVNGPLGVSQVLRVARQIAAGLAAAHAQGLVHRDIKPSNVLLEDGVERLQITDFGLARAADDASLTRTGVIAGTPQFMSPEQSRGDLVDARSDLFSLGSVMYAMCTGRPPFRAETSYGILRRICDDVPRPIRETTVGIPEWLEAFVARLHAKNAVDRFQTAAEVSVLLEQCLAHFEQPTTTPLPEAVAALVKVTPSKTPNRRAAQLLSIPLSVRRAVSQFASTHPRILIASVLATVMIVLAVTQLAGIGSGAKNGELKDTIPHSAANSAEWNSSSQSSSSSNGESSTNDKRWSTSSSEDSGTQAAGRGTAALKNLSGESDEVSGQLRQLQSEIDDLEARVSAFEELQTHDSNSGEQEFKP